MMMITGCILFWIYIIALSVITVYCLAQFHLLLQYRKYKALVSPHVENQVEAAHDNPSLPTITIQLPIYNEKYVVGRLIDNIMEMDYPRELLDVQVIDDSDDMTRELAAEKVKFYKNKGYQIEHVIRKIRSGYKAGALKDSLPMAKGELIAIFDADFLPNNDFLLKVISFFDDPKVGVVQTRWEHLNESYSLLTRLQAYQLNVHFTVEQKGRDHSDYLLQFNGTAGIWRKSAIEDAGGWEADTLTEDLDLSYRAQLKGWKIVFREDIASPAELPAEMNGLKSQQFRWMKGGAETAKKILPEVWKSKIGSVRKFHATVHLLSSTVYLFVFLLGILSVPILLLLKPTEEDTTLLSFFAVSLFCITVVYIYANVDLADKKRPLLFTIIKMAVIFPLFLSLSMGLSLHNSVAVMMGYFGKKTSFVRTPKFNIQTLKDTFASKGDYLYKTVSVVTMFEGILAFYFALAIYLGFVMDNYLFTILHFLLFAGYSTVFYYSVRHIAPVK